MEILRLPSEPEGSAELTTTPVPITDVPAARLRKVYTWPDPEETGSGHTYRHMTNFCITRKDDGKLVPVWEVIPLRTERKRPVVYVLTGTLLPRPGCEEEGVLEVEIDTLGGYSIDFGDENQDPKRMFSRGIWFKDKTQLKKGSGLYYRCHEPASPRYSPLFNKITRDLLKMYALHDKLIYTDQIELDPPERCGKVTISMRSKYSDLVLSLNVQKGTYWRLKRDFSIEDLCREQSDLDADWINDKDHADFFWDNCSSRFLFNLKLPRASKFSKQLDLLRRGEISLNFDSSSDNSQDDNSEMEEEEEEEDEEEEEEDNIAEAQVATNTTAQDASSPRNANMIQKRKRVDCDDEIVTEAPVIAAAPPKPAPKRSAFSVTQYASKMGRTGNPGAPPAVALGQAATTESSSSSSSASKKKSSSRRKNEDEEEEISPERIKRLMEMGEKQRQREAELKDEQKKRDEKYRAKERFRPELDSNGEGDVKFKPKIVRKASLQTARSKWLYGCEMMCSCREAGQHPVQFVGEPDPVESTHTCVAYSGYPPLPEALPQAPTTIRFPEAANLCVEVLFYQTSAPKYMRKECEWDSE